MSKLGTMVCPILRSHGFWDGCNFYVKAFLVISSYNFITGFVLVKLRSFLKIGVFSNNLLYHILYSAGFALMVFQIFPLFVARVELTGTPYSPVLELMFIATLIASYSLTIKLNDYLMVIETFDQTRPGSQKESGIVHTLSEHFHKLLGFLTPLGCMAVFTLMVLQSIDQGSEWTDPERNFSNILAAAGWMIGWYVLFTFLDYLKKDFVVYRLRLKAVSLGQKNKMTDICLENLEGLFEIGKALNKSSQTIKEKNRLEKGFSQFVSGDITDKILRSDVIENSSEEHVACVFMIDLRNFTETSRKLSGGELVKWLNHYYECLSQHFESHEIILDKFIGDGVLAYTLANNEHFTESRVRETTEALMQLFSEVEKVSIDMASKGLPPIEIGIGIDYGKVMIGLVGASNKKQHTVIGNPVNNASRLESMCKTYSACLVISDKVYQSLDPETQGDFTQDSNAKIKGLDGPQTVFHRSMKVSKKAAS